MVIKAVGQIWLSKAILGTASEYPAWIAKRHRLGETRFEVRGRFELLGTLVVVIVAQKLKCVCCYSCAVVCICFAYVILQAVIKHTRIMLYAPFLVIPCEQPAVRTYELSLFVVELILVDRVAPILSHELRPSLFCLWLVPCVIEYLGNSHSLTRSVTTLIPGYPGFSAGRGDDSAGGAPRGAHECMGATHSAHSGNNNKWLSRYRLNNSELLAKDHKGRAQQQRTASK
ncbi:geraniol 8-hydroxylase-like [Dorcoceras hygrometricum]|uniref:Geraniol 8-hydroxylase-like n=1 Tax=Dorcoceras hygrometricum TaxID=472368 RepID=A0A2Z7BF77_9LAMI|nr:geraniol 8-hydroxylase-like [Dorcoceras hygrometricum]